MLSDKPQVQQLVLTLVKKGITDVVISPGSRNGPISTSFFHHNAIRTYTITDERSAAFFALGIGMQTGKAAAIVCTSGSAALNYFPAIAESFYQRVPLIVITADRPSTLINQEEGQSIQQRNVFGSHVKYSVQLQEGSSQEVDWFNNRCINEAYNVCMKGTKGPVHINIPLSEPLYEFSDSTINPRIIEALDIDRRLSSQSVHELADRINSAEKILVIAGQLNPNEHLLELINHFQMQTNAFVLSETSSNLISDQTCSSIDRLIMCFDQEENKSFKPDLLITIGINVISKKVKALVRSLDIGEHWRIDENENVVDTFQCLSKTISISPKQFFKQVNPELKRATNQYGSYWLKKNQDCSLNHAQFVSTVPWSDLQVFDKIIENIPSNSVLHMGNSSVVRYIQLFDHSSNLSYYGNRGTSGIDGSTSTAVGHALHEKRTVTLISGDLSFIYDSNALWNEYLSDNLKIIVVNNGGGGIFKIIEGPNKTKALEECFEVSHRNDIKHIAAQHSLSYMNACNSEELEVGLDWLYSNEGCSILEIDTANCDNERILKDYFKFLKKNYN